MKLRLTIVVKFRENELLNVGNDNFSKCYATVKKCADKTEADTFKITEVDMVYDSSKGGYLTAILGEMEYTRLIDEVTDMDVSMEELHEIALKKFDAISKQFLTGYASLFALSFSWRL